jgi:hypothetical protein
VNWALNVISTKCFGYCMYYYSTLFYTYYQKRVHRIRTKELYSYNFSFPTNICLQGYWLHLLTLNILQDYKELQPKPSNKIIYISRWLLIFILWTYDVCRITNDITKEVYVFICKSTSNFDKSSTLIRYIIQSHLVAHASKLKTH